MSKIAFAKFPFLEKSNYKNRPILILTEVVDDLIVAAYITSKTNKEILDSDIILDKESEYFVKTGLNETSIIRLHKVASIPISKITQELGHIPEEITKLIKTKLKYLFQI